MHKHPAAKPSSAEQNRSSVYLWLLFVLLIGAWVFVPGAQSGSSTALVTEVNHPRIHATLLAMAISDPGMALGPFVTGLIADFIDLKTAMLVMPLASLLAVACFMAGNRHYPQDRGRYNAVAESSLEAMEEQLIQGELPNVHNRSIDQPR